MIRQFPEPLRQKHQFPKPKSERLPKDKPVTIAACFEFDGGVLFCADTKLNTAMKSTQTKIFDRVYENRHCASVFVLSGVVPFAKSAIEACESMIAKLDHITVSAEEIRVEIETSLASFHHTHIYPHPKPDDVEFQLLIGIWLRGETYMFMTYESTVSRITDRYECIGNGAYLAKYWTRKFFSTDGWKGDPHGPNAGDSCTLEDVALISAFALKSAMDYDETCGGQAQFMIMKNNGQIGWEVETAIPFPPCDEVPDQIINEMWKMLRKLIRAEDTTDVSMVASDFEYSVGKIIERRAEWIRMLTSDLKDSIAKP